MNSWRALVTIDLKLLVHRPENLLATILYGIMILVVVHFSIPAGTGQSIIMGIAALWLSLILSGVLGLPRLQHHRDAVSFLPQLITGDMTTTGYYWAKLFSGSIVLLFTSLILFPLAVVLFNFPLIENLIYALGILEIGTVGIVIILTIGSALTVGRETWLLPLLVFPLLLPIVLAGTQLMASLFTRAETIPWGWLHVLVAYNLLMLLGGWFLSDFLWEELPE